MGKMLQEALKRPMAEHKQTPWSWHAKSADQAHNGSIYRMERPGHAYAIAMQPRYVSDEQFSADAAFICKAVNNHEALVEAASALIEEIVTRGTHERWKPLAKLIRTLTDVGGSPK